MNWQGRLSESAAPGAAATNGAPGDRLRRGAPARSTVPAGNTRIRIERPGPPHRQIPATPNGSSRGAGHPGGTATAPLRSAFLPQLSHQRHRTAGKVGLPRVEAPAAGAKGRLPSSEALEHPAPAAPKTGRWPQPIPRFAWSSGQLIIYSLKGVDVMVIAQSCQISSSWRRSPGKSGPASSTADWSRRSGPPLAGQTSTARSSGSSN